MSDQPRALPDRPNLRFLKIEAKRRHEAGEFATLHDAQLAIAREHGQPSWTALKRIIEANPALIHVQWLIGRFSGAGAAGWAAPDDAELREHFDDHFLTAIPPSRLVERLTRASGRLRGELIVAGARPLTLHAQISDLQIEAVAAAGPPHRLTGLRAYPVGKRVTDHRVAAPATRTDGEAPAAAERVAEESVAELGLAGIVLAGEAGGRPWAVARGWADLERGEELRPDHRFPAYSITKLVTATAVLRLVADDRIGLDDRANAHLRRVVLADDAVTVRELLTHTGGVAGRTATFADHVPDLAALVGPVVGATGGRGTFAYSNLGYELLGRIVAGVTGYHYADAVTHLVLDPLAMTGSWFPAAWPDSGAITGYELTADGRFAPVERRVCTLPAAGGLWTTAADLIRFGRDWATLLPDDLAREALRPQAVREPGMEMGLGWPLNRPRDVYGHAGGGVGATSSLIVRASTGRPTVALTNRVIPIEPVNARLVAG